MSVHEDLLNNGESNCSFTEDEVDIMCSKDGDDACRDGSVDVCVQPSWQMLTGESPVEVKVGKPLSQ